MGPGSRASRSAGMTGERMASLQPVHVEPRRVRAVKLCAPKVMVDRRPDGTIYLKSPHELPAYPKRITDRLVHWATTAPDRAFMADSGAGGEWSEINFAADHEESR